MADVRALLEEFDRISKSPKQLLKEYNEAGEKVVGCFYYTPQPLITALGMVPMGLWGGQVNPQVAGKYSPIFTCSILRSCLEYGMTGEYEGLSAAIMPILCDTFRGTCSAWRAGVNIKLIPFVHPQNRKDPGALDYLIEEYKYVKSELEDVAGKTCTDAELKASIRLHNQKNKVIREFCSVANDHLDIITAVERHHVMKAITFMKPEIIIEKLTALIEALKAEPVCNWTGKKVILTGITAEPDDLLAGFTANNIAVVGDDLMQESRLYRTDYPSANSAMESLALQWLQIKGCSMAHDDNNRARGENLVEMARAKGADAVVCCMMRFCDTEEYDEPYILETVRNAGFMAFSIDIDQSTSDSGQAITKIQAFAENNV